MILGPVCSEGKNIITQVGQLIKQLLCENFILPELYPVNLKQIQLDLCTDYKLGPCRVPGYPDTRPMNRVPGSVLPVLLPESEILL